MKEEDIRTKVKEIIQNVLVVEDEELDSPNFNLSELGDSLDLVEIIMFIEREFDIGIPDDDVRECSEFTVNKIVEYIIEKLK